MWALYSRMPLCCPTHRADLPGTTSHLVVPCFDLLARALCQDGSRVVGFYVEPFTVKHKFANGQTWDGEDIRTAPPLTTCDKSGPMVFESIGEKQEVKPGRVLFTYDVMWRASNVKWASRWDIYLTMDNAVPDKVRGHS
jgi:transmembrane 9 superfamily protein 2/4